MSVGLSISARDSVFISRVSAPKQILKWSCEENEAFKANKYASSAPVVYSRERKREGWIVTAIAR